MHVSRVTMAAHAAAAAAAYVFANVVVHDCAPCMSLVFKFRFGFSKSCG